MPLGERYADAAAYEAALEEAADGLVAAGLMRGADIGWSVEAAPALGAAD